MGNEEPIVAESGLGGQGGDAAVSARVEEPAGRSGPEVVAAGAEEPAGPSGLEIVALTAADDKST